MKKKIKRFFGFIFALLILAVSVFVYCPNTKADTTYTNIYFGIAHYSNHINYVDVYGYYDSSLNSRSFPYWYYTEAPGYLLLYSEEEEESYNYGVPMIFYGYYTGSNNQLFNVTQTTDDLRVMNDWQPIYNAGYDYGYSRQIENANEVAYQRGKEDAIASIIPGSPIYQNIYDAGVDAESSNYVVGATGYTRIYDAGYADALDDIGEEDATFLVMFKSVINYFVEFFTVGLNVELFGVNIGGFCIAIFMLSIMMFIVRFIFGR